MTIKGSNEWNEDALIINESVRLFGVLDGATSLRPFRGPNGETGGYLASQLVKRELERLAASDLDSVPLHSAVLRANARLREEMAEHGIDVARKEDLWTTGVAAVRIGENNIEYAQAGDCMIAAFYKDGSIRTVSYDQVDHIDQQTKRMWEDGVKQGMTTREQLRKLVEPTILYNKRTMNTLDGYAVLSGEPELAEFLEYGRISRIQLSGLLIVTDGLFLPAGYELSEAERAAGMETLVRLIRDKSLRGYAEWLIDLEESDPECQRYPRFKKSDDKTGVLLTFE